MRQITLTRFLIDEQYNQQAVPADLRLLVEVVSRAIKAISINVGKGALAGILGEHQANSGAADASVNVQGEAQKKLDVIANEILLEANEWGGHLAAMASEEMADPHPIPHRYPKGEYLLLFDPLDGSSNIDVNASVGTIFSVLKCPEGVTTPTGYNPLRCTSALRSFLGRSMKSNALPATTPMLDVGRIVKLDYPRSFPNKNA